MAHVERHAWVLCSTCEAAGRTRPAGGAGCRCKVTKWRTRWRTPDGKARSQVFDRKRDADKHAVKVENDKLAGTYVDPKAGRTSFRAYAEEWRKIQPHAEGTGHLVEQHLRLHVYPSIGDRPIGAIRPSEVQALVSGSTLSASTIEVVYGRVTSVFKAAVRDKVIPSSPCVGIKLPRPPRRVDTVMTTKHVVALAEAIAPRYRALVLVGAGTGLRPGELFGLTVPALDLLRRDLRVERQLVRRRGEGVVLTPRLKTETSYRNVPLAPVVVEVIAAHLATWPAHRELGLVFTNERGAPIQQYPFGQAWATARKRAKLPMWVNGPHQLRHHYASLLIASGSSVKVVQRRLGHASAKTTLDIYGHMFPDDEDATRAAVEGPLAAALGGVSRAVGGG